MLRAVRETSLETGTAPKRRKNRKSAVHVVSKAQATRELQIPDSVIDQILKEMKVPESRWGDASWEVLCAVQSCAERFTEGRLGVKKSRYTWRPRHRPRGSVNYPHIRDLVYDLYVIGKLTLSKDVAGAKTKGSLPAVLEILHDQLSPEIFPSDMAFNTLKAMRLWAKECLEDRARDYLSHLDEDDLSDCEEDDRSV